MAVEETLRTSGERLKRARVLAGISTRREFEKKHSISANTLQGWEQGKNPLSSKGARRVVEALKSEGLICTIEWLLEGKGMPPRPYEMLNLGATEPILNESNWAELNLREEEAIYQEKQLFKTQNPNAIILTVTDDAMEPYWAVGDYVGGVRIANHDLDKYLGRACILELENNLIIPRILQAGTQEGTWTAASTNPTTSAAPLNLYNVKVISAAPVVWHRRKLTSL